MKTRNLASVFLGSFLASSLLIATTPAYALPVGVAVHGELHDHDDAPFDSDEHKSFDWVWDFDIAPGGGPIVREGRDCVDNEVEMRVACTFTMDVSNKLWTTCDLQLFEGDDCGEEFEAGSRGGPDAVERNRFAAFTYGVNDDQGDWGSIALTVVNR